MATNALFRLGMLHFTDGKAFFYEETHKYTVFFKRVQLWAGELL